MSGLSPVARMDRPSRVFRNRASRNPTHKVRTATGISLQKVLPMRGCTMEKTVAAFIILTLEEKPMTARFTVYSPVLVMIPARIEGICSFVCKKAVTEPAQAPASMAAGRPRMGCPATAKVADTAQPKVKAPSVVISAMFSTRKLRNRASATSA